MIKYTKGNILESEAKALVNTVNTVGVMGKGIALQFKKAFTHNNKKYVQACKNQELEPGRLLSVWDENFTLGKKLIINFPTKKHWRHRSKYEYVEKGLKALRELLQEKQVNSVAIPPLGCGHGGLQWSKIKQLMEDYLGDLTLDVLIYQPNENIKKMLQQEETKQKARLTPARALLLYSLYAYESAGEYSSLFAANKLAYFLQRMGQPMNLKFQPYLYGPYTNQVERVLYELNGVYLKGLEQQETKPFKPLDLNYKKFEEVEQYINTQLNQKENQRLKQLIELLNGFTSELSLEILATVDYIVAEYPCYGVDDIMEEINQWNLRKKELLERSYVEIAYNHLRQYKERAFPT